MITELNCSVRVTVDSNGDVDHPTMMTLIEDKLRQSLRSWSEDSNIIHSEVVVYHVAGSTSHTGGVPGPLDRSTTPLKPTLANKRS